MRKLTDFAEPQSFRAIGSVPLALAPSVVFFRSPHADDSE